MATLFGHGYIGTAIAKGLVEAGMNLYWYHHADVRHVILDKVIIDCAGFVGHPNMDACEEHKKECIEGNIIWPIKLEERYRGVPIIHISSGGVYTGYKDGGWTEEDKPNFKDSFYSLTKILEQENLNLKNNYLLRIRSAFEKEDDPRNYLTKLKTYSRLIDTRNSLSSLVDIVAVVLFFVRELPEPGIYNVCNSGSITTKEIIEMFGIKKEWFSMEEFNAHVKAPRSFCTLNTDKLSSIFPIRDVTEALRECTSRK